MSKVRWEREGSSRVVLTGLGAAEVLIQRNSRRQWEPWIEGKGTGGAYANLTDARWDVEGELRDRGLPLPEDVPFEGSHDDDDGGWCGNWKPFLEAQE